MSTLQGSAICPRRLTSLEEHQFENERLVYCPKLEIGVSLNPSALQIWNLCTGERTIIEITEDLGHQLGIEDQTVLEELLYDVEATVLQFQELGIVETIS